MLIYSARPSRGCTELANALGIKRGSGRVNRPYKGTLINWGSLHLPKRFNGVNVINRPEAIAEVSNKLIFFKKITPKYTKNSLTPEWTEDQNKAQEWIDNGNRVVVRSILSGSGGIGINICDTQRPLLDAPLYVKYIPKDEEYRVHVFNNNNGPSVIDVQKKARRHDVPDDEVNWEIRNHDNGFVYKRNDIHPPACVLEVATKCMSQLSLHFGACDVIFNKKQDRAYCLEINTAPGLEGTTVVNYAKAFKELLKC